MFMFGQRLWSWGRLTFRYGSAVPVIVVMMVVVIAVAVMMVAVIVRTRSRRRIRVEMRTQVVTGRLAVPMRVAADG